MFFEALVRPVLMAALVALIAYVSTSLLAATTLQVWVLTAGVLVATAPFIVSSGFHRMQERHRMFWRSRPYGYLPAFEMAARPAMLMLPVLVAAWYVRVGAATRLGVDPSMAGMVLGFGMVAIALSVHSRRYRSD